MKTRNITHCQKIATIMSTIRSILRLHGVRPSFYPELNSLNKSIGLNNVEYALVQTLRKAERAVAIGALKTIKNTDDQIIPSVFIRWASAENLKIPKELLGILKKELWKELEKYNIDIPNSFFRVVWKKLPQEFRNTGGRPSEKNKSI